MPVKWKKKFKPELVLARIAATRTRNPDGKGSSFSGWDLDYCLPSLHSMLEFPDIARDMDHAALIWRAAAYDPGELTKDSFLRALNEKLSAELSQREKDFHVLTSLSLDNKIPLASSTVEGVQLRFCGSSYPRKYANHRSSKIETHRVPAAESPSSYMRVIAVVTAKTPALAFTSALRAVDIHRALWCLFCNMQMEMVGRSWIPINSVRLGAIHTVHVPSGELAGDDFWFEPHQALKDAYRPREPAAVRNRVGGILRRLGSCPYRQDLIAAILLFVRALDEWNQTTAFIRLWSALERLASPGYGDYDTVVRRCSFLWKDVAFAAQTLEHLREYRNGFMHAGTESTQAKTYCFQLQQQFRTLLLFHIGNARRFATLQEANAFLDLPPDLSILARLGKTISRAQRFRAPA